MVHEAGHPEPWIIALSQVPSVHTAFDYGLRWGIEGMFSDFKSRGFGLEDSQIRLPGRLDRLILDHRIARRARTAGTRTTVNVDALPDHLYVPDVALRLRCSACGSKRIVTRPNWREPPLRQAGLSRSSSLGLL